MAVLEQRLISLGPSQFMHSMILWILLKLSFKKFQPKPAKVAAAFIVHLQHCQDLGKSSQHCKSPESTKNFTNYMLRCGDLKVYLQCLAVSAWNGVGKGNIKWLPPSWIVNITIWWKSTLLIYSTSLLDSMREQRLKLVRDQRKEILTEVLKEPQSIKPQDELLPWKQWQAQLSILHWASYQC